MTASEPMIRAARQPADELRSTRGDAPVPASRRRGFSLLEMLLVLALLVLTAAIVWPVLDGTLANYELRSGAELVRATWSAARVRAMDDGVTYQFRFEPGGRQYVAAPYEESLTEAGDTSLAAGASGPGAAAERPPWIEHEVLASRVAFPTGEPAATGASIPGVPTDVPWSEPILFFPDGTTSDASLVLTNTQGFWIELRLRGLTGIVTVAEPEAGEPPAGQ